MSTEHLDLESINGADFVDNEAFNRNFDKIDPLGKCYVTEAGTSGEWSYKKYSDGTAECWIDDKAFADMTKSAWGSMYRTPEVSFGAYPFSFSARPYAVVSFNNCTNSDHASYVTQHATASVTQSPPFALCDPNSGTVGAPHFGILVKGRV